MRLRTSIRLIFETWNKTQNNQHLDQQKSDDLHINVLFHVLCLYFSHKLDMLAQCYLRQFQHILRGG